MPLAGHVPVTYDHIRSSTLPSENSPLTRTCRRRAAVLDRTQAGREREEIFNTYGTVNRSEPDRVLSIRKSYIEVKRTLVRIKLPVRQ